MRPSQSKSAQLGLAFTLLISLPSQAGVWAHYPFDSNYDDTSGSARNGTFTDVGTLGNSGITTSSGSYKFGGGALNLHAERDYVVIPEKTFASGVSYSYAFWARKSAGDAGQAAQFDMVVGDRNNTNFFMALSDQTGGRTGFRWRSSDSTTARQADFAAPDDTNWHHYAVVASGTTVTFYVDGAFVSNATGKLTGFTSNTIGEAYVNTSDFDFNGQIDEMWIFDEALTATKVAGLYGNNDPNYVAAYAGFHHRYDSDFSDSSGAGNGGTAVGAAAITSDPVSIAKGSGALSLDGADGSYVTLTNPGAFSATTPWSTSWWARRASLGTDKGMVMGTAASTSDFIWLNDTFTGLRFRSSNATTLDFTAPKDQLLHHYALVADGAGSLALYLDGQLTQTLTGNTAFAIDTIGKAYPNTSLHYNFNGSLDEVHVYNSALSASQVNDLYAAEQPVVTVTKLRVVLLGGQSNADGRSLLSEFPTSPRNLQLAQHDVSFYYKIQSGSPTLTTLRPGLSETAQSGPEILLGRRLADLYKGESGTRVAIIKYANGGTDLKTGWKAGGNATTTGDGPEYVTFQQTVTQGLAALTAAYPEATVELQSMVWLQGESDAVSGSASLYQANLTAFIADVRATYGASLPFVIARLSSQQTNLDATQLNLVRSAEDAVAAADPRTSIFSTDDFGIKSDNLHFNGAGQQSIGSAFAEDSAYYKWMVETFGSSDINAGRGERDVDFDGDGQSNLTEFLGSTDPLSGSSIFQAAYSRTGVVNGTISYPTSAGRLYSVQHYVESSGLWETVLPVLRGTGSTVVRTLNNSATSGLYRVKSELP